MRVLPKPVGDGSQSTISAERAEGRDAPNDAFARQIDIDKSLAHKTKRALYVDCDSVTLYGAVLQTTNLEYNGHQIEVDFIELRALLRFWWTTAHRLGRTCCSGFMAGTAMS